MPKNIGMAETDIQTGAESALTSALSGGQANAMDGMSKTAVSAMTAYQIAQLERERLTRTQGRRPLFRGINMGAISGQ